jgi:hypothetical protein
MEEKRQKLVTFAPSMFCVCVFYLSSEGGGLYFGANRGGAGGFISQPGD